MYVTEGYMRKDLAVICTILIASTALSFVCAGYLLNDSFALAVLVSAMYFLGGLFLPFGRVGMKVHASWIGISMGFFGAVLFFLPAAVST